LAEKERAVKRRQRFDEVMIVNPGPGGPGNHAGERTMRFAYYGAPQGYGNTGYGNAGYGHAGYGQAEPTGVGYYGEPVGYYGAPPYGYAPGPVHGYGYAPQYAAAPQYGHYAAAPHYGAPPQYGAPQFHGAPNYGAYGEHEPVGYYADEAPPMGYYGNDPYAQPVGPVAGYGAYAGYADVPPEMAGYGEPYGQYAAEDPSIGAEEFADEYPGVAESYGDYAADPEFAGYERERPPPFNAGCPMPTNVGLGDAEPFAGYVRPATVGPTCPDLVPQTSVSSELPETLRPLW
jgi:hypothetical protein